MRSGNVMPLLYPFDLEDGVFDDCPYDVINGHLRCWNSIDEKVVGVSVMMPIFQMVLWIITPVNMGQVF